jgi:hypothetical protein
VYVDGYKEARYKVGHELVGLCKEIEIKRLRKINRVAETIRAEIIRRVQMAEVQC